MDLQANNQRKIHLLPEHIVDQIKAGEVVERPSALLKELMENAIDAGATRIDIQIRDNGLELISIEDNGEGMDMEDLPYAFCRHATSKITQFEDLYRLHSYGFRGEALASISSISRVTCTSSPKSDPARGGRIIFHGGKQEDWSALPSTSNGTSFFVKDLFYNTPARLKFLKSKTAESNALKRVFNSFILTHPEVSFSIKWDDKEKSLFPKCKPEDLNKRISKVFFKKNPSEETLADLNYLEVDYEGTKLKGFYSSTTSKSASGKAQYFFVNGRLFVDKALHQAFLRSAEKYWGYGEYGHYCLFIDLPPDQVDVNVHPGKIHVKFLKPSVIFGLVSQAIQVESENNAPSTTESFDQKESLSSEHLWNTFTKGGAEQSNLKSKSEINNFGRSVFPLTERFFIFRKEEKTYMVEKALFVGQFLNESFNNFNPSMTTPLLIGEALPFPKGKADKVIHDLSAYGFEVDRVDERTLILRASHPNLVAFDLNRLLNLLIEDMISFSGFNLDDFLTRNQEELSESLKLTRFESLWNKVQNQDHYLKKSVKELSEDSLKRFFSEEL